MPSSFSRRSLSPSDLMLLKPVFESGVHVQRVGGASTRASVIAVLSIVEFCGGGFLVGDGVVIVLWWFLFPCHGRHRGRQVEVRSHFGSSHFGSSQSGNSITAEVLLTGFLFAYDVVMSGLWHGQSRPPTEVHRSGLSASRWTSVGLGQSQGYEERQSHAYVGVFGQSTMDVSRLFLPELRVARLLPQLQSRRQLWGTWKQWRWQSCKEAGSASDFRGLPLGGVRKVAWR